MSEDKTKTPPLDEIKTPTTQPMLDVIIERLNNLYHQNEASQLLTEELRSDVKSRFDVLEAQQNELRSDVNNRFDVFEAQQNELRSDINNRLEVMEAQLNELREETKKGFRNIENNLVVIARDILQIKANQFDLNSRVDDREHPAS